MGIVIRFVRMATIAGFSFIYRPLMGQVTERAVARRMGRFKMKLSKGCMARDTGRHWLDLLLL